MNLPTRGCDRLRCMRTGRVAMQLKDELKGPWRLIMCSNTTPCTRSSARKGQ